MAERRSRPVRTTTVRETQWLSPSMVRVVFGGGDLQQLEPPAFTDAYVKILFAPTGAPYQWPFDPDAVREEHPRELWPVTRTYTVRAFDPVTHELTIDFVVHGDAGLAGPWAAAAQPGDGIGFHGPGGGYAPAPDAAHHLLVGDEAALPAIAAALEALPCEATADVFLEVTDQRHRLDLPADARPGVTVHWVHRDGEPYGAPLAAAVRTAGVPRPGTQVFVHGNAEMVRNLRRFLFVDSGFPRSAVSISGYWRTGYTEDRWQSTKGEFNQQMETEEQVTVG